MSRRSAPSTQHPEPHPLAGKVIRIKDSVAKYGGKEFRLEDWWDRLGSGSWMFAAGNPACIIYAVRSAVEKLPIDDEVVYGHVGAFGHLFHASELATAPAVVPELAGRG